MITIMWLFLMFGASWLGYVAGRNEERARYERQERRNERARAEAQTFLYRD